MTYIYVSIIYANIGSEIMDCRLFAAKPSFEKCTVLFLIGPFAANNFQWHSDQNTTIFVQENIFENVVCKTAAILS